MKIKYESIENLDYKPCLNCDNIEDIYLIDTVIDCAYHLNDDVSFPFKRKGYYIKCNKCGFEPNTTSESINEAIQAWNAIFELHKKGYSIKR